MGGGGGEARGGGGGEARGGGGLGEGAGGALASTKQLLYRFACLDTWDRIRAGTRSGALPQLRNGEQGRADRCERRSNSNHW